MTLQLFLSLLTVVISNAMLIGALAWNLSGRLTRIEGRIRALEIVHGIRRGEETQTRSI